jgi:hypothetical protein
MPVKADWQHPMKHPHHARRNPFPSLKPCAQRDPAWIKMAAPLVLLPDAGTVCRFPGSLFPTVRDLRRKGIPLSLEGNRTGIYDDDTTPRWALLWSHGIPGQSKLPLLGWTICHAWDRGHDPDAYTRLANLFLVPEFLASLAGEQGPLTPHLRYHAWRVYHWKPAGEETPAPPDDYTDALWNYLPPVEDPEGFFQEEWSRARCQRSRKLRLCLQGEFS